MDAALELSGGSRWSEKDWEVREGEGTAGGAGGLTRASLRRTSFWKASWEASAGGDEWTFDKKGTFSRGLKACAAGEEVARYDYQRGNDDAVVLADGTRLGVRRARRMHAERVLTDGEGRELARFHPRGWKRGIGLELGPGGLREAGVVLPVLLVCAVLLVERQNSQSSATAAGVAGAAGT